MKNYSLLLLLVMCLVTNNSWSYEYDPLLMRAQASIFPKIILLDKDLSKKIDENKVVISILYGTNEESVAEKLKGLIRDQYKTNLGKRELEIRNVGFDDFDEESNVSTAYILLKGAGEQRNKVTRAAVSKKRLVFCYDYQDFENNALVSVLMKEKTYIYLNKSAIHDYDIKFLPLFYKIVKVIE